MDDKSYRRDVELAIGRDELDELRELVVEMALESDQREFAETCCAQLAKHRDAVVRGNALLGLGHLARRFGRLNRERVHRLVEIALWDRNDYVRSQAESAAEDIEIFLAWEFDRPA